MVDEVAMREVDAWIERAPREYRNVLQMVRELSLDLTMDDSTDPAKFEIMEAILAAEDLDSLFAAANAGTTSGKDFTDRPFYWDGNGQYKLSSVGLRSPGGFPFYWLGKVTDMSTGERIVLNCGGTSFVPVFWRMGKLNPFDKYGAEGVPMILKEKKLDESRSLILPALYVMPSAPAGKSKTVKGEKISD